MKLQIQGNTKVDELSTKLFSKLAVGWASQAQQRWACNNAPVRLTLSYPMTKDPNDKGAQQDEEEAYTENQSSSTTVKLNWEMTTNAYASICINNIPPGIKPDTTWKPWISTSWSHQKGRRVAPRRGGRKVDCQGSFSERWDLGKDGLESPHSTRELPSQKLPLGCAFRLVCCGKWRVSIY